MTRISTILVPALLVSLAACDGGDDDTTDTDTDDTDVAADTARVRLTHLGVFPDGVASDVDIFVNGEASGITFAFKDTTDYVELPVGTYDFDIVPAGGTLEDSVFQVAGFELQADESWSVFAAGAAAPIEGMQDFTVSAFADDASDIPEGNIRLNIVHGAALTALDPVDVWVADSDCAPVGDDPLLDDFAFLATSGSVDLPAGALGVAFDIGGDATVDACFQVPDLGGDALVNVYAVNDAAGAVSLLAHLPDGAGAEVDPTPIEAEPARIRLAHFGVFPDGISSDVDIFVNGAASGITFGFKQTTDYVELDPGTYDFDVVPAGGVLADSVFSVEDFTLEAGADWSIFAAGAPVSVPNQQGFTVGAFPDDASGIPDGQIRLNVVHAAALTALDPVDVWVVDGACAPVGSEPLLDDFAFTAASGNVDLPAGALGVGFDVGGDATVDACFQVPDLGGDKLVNVYATNDAAGNVSLVAHLPEGTSAEVTPERDD